MKALQINIVSDFTAWPQKLIRLLIVFLLAHSSLSAQEVYDRLARDLQAELDHMVEEFELPGVIFALRLDGEHGFTMSSGMADLENGIAMPADARMLSGSTGKLFFAALALKLIENGELGLEDLAADHLAGKDWYRTFPNHNTIKVRHLLNHTSGLPRHLFQESFLNAFTAALDRTWTPEECVQYLCDLEPLFPAGEGWSYSDANFILLGFIIEALTGRDIYEMVNEEFIVPLGLDRTVPSVERIIPGLTQGYVGNQNPFRLPSKVLDENDRMVLDPSLEWTGGGFATNPRDLAEFVAFIQESDYLNEDSKALMRSAVNTENGRPFDQGYGLGCFVWSKRNDTRIGHPGFFPGYVTHVEYSLARQYALAIQVNSDARSSYLKQMLFELEEVIDRFLDDIDEYGIHMNFERQEECWNAGDLKCYMTAYAVDTPIKTVSRGGVTVGYDRILANYERYFPKDKMGKLHFDEFDFQRLSDTYYFVTGRFNLTLEDRDEPAQGYFSVIMKRINGGWMIITDHSS